MHALPVFEKTEAYLNVHIGHTGPGGIVKTPGPFVTLSRESGAGGSGVAHALVDLLNGDAAEPRWAIYSANLMDEMLRSAGLPPRLARFMPEDRIPEIEALIGEIIGLHPNLWSLIDKTNELIRRLARDGHAIFLGRGANFATSGIANGVHVRLVASAAFRAERTARWLGIDIESAAQHNAQRDAARGRYVRATFGADLTNASDYDLVINAATVPPATAANVIAGFVRAHRTVPVAPTTTASLAASETAVFTG
ncbi:MAG TPA: cytidylate kinase-like family protein [Opitutaceae bacterium]|nr:cytidylate kinase-like family protein [Opitutaceae bacterium]